MEAFEGQLRQTRHHLHKGGLISAVQGDPRVARENSGHQLVIGDAVAVSGNADGEVDKGKATEDVRTAQGTEGSRLDRRTPNSANLRA